ncbi:MAG TPA: LPXTG cell wall anchor domain-containing protein [Bryobacteraceae bacterium]|nr:LPXTG cell wall anchor domain-containing protein [Bryobacteraceae bacterium]
MNNKWNATFLGGLVALSFFVTKPVVADEWNKKTEFQFSAPVEIPGRVLMPGKYVFELADNPADRNIVQVFSEDSAGNESLVATVMAVSDYTSNTPEQPALHFEERHSGRPEAIQSWFYPGDNTGWEFVYPKQQNPEAGANTMPSLAPVTTATAPILPPPPQAQKDEQASEEAAVEEEVMVAQNDASVPPPPQDTDARSGAARVLPETGGYSGLELMTGLFMMLGGGMLTVFVSRRKSLA